MIRVWLVFLVCKIEPVKDVFKHGDGLEFYNEICHRDSQSMRPDTRNGKKYSNSINRKNIQSLNHLLALQSLYFPFISSSRFL